MRLWTLWKLRFDLWAGRDCHRHVVIKKLGDSADRRAVAPLVALYVGDASSDHAAAQAVKCHFMYYLRDNAEVGENPGKFA